MKRLLFLLFTIFYSSHIIIARIISLDFFTQNETTFAKFIVVNQLSNIISPIEKNDLQVFENGTLIQNFNLTNIEPPTNNTSTLLFLFDLSIGNIDTSNKSLAIKILDTLFKEFPNCNKGFLGFDFENYLFCNFTNDVQKLTNSIQYLNNPPSSSSNFDTALIGVNLGAINLIKNNSTPKTIVLITDKNKDFDFQKVEKLSIEFGIKFIIILINNESNEKFLRFARNINSYIFSINKYDELLDKLSALRLLAYDGKPISIEWKNLPICNQLRNIKIIFKKTDTLFFFTTVQNSSLPILNAYPPFLRYSSVIPGQSKDLELTLVARNFNIKIDSFKLHNPHFKIISGNISSPFILLKDSSHKLTIRFTPSDSSIVFDSLVIYSEACQVKKINITGGFPNKKPKERTLSILHPACGDQFFIGDTIHIRWEGLLPTDVVQLQYSTNGGESWDTLAINVLGLDYKFYLDPNKFQETDSFLIRVIQIWPNNAGETIELRHLSAINSANFNRDASLIVTSSSHPDEFALVWNPGTGSKIFNLKGHTKQVNWSCFDNQDRYVITASDDSTSILYDIKSGDSLFTFKGHKSKVTSANFSPDGNYVVTSGTDGKCIVWDLNSKKSVYTLSTGINPIYFASFTPDTNFIAYASYDGNIYLFDIKKLKVTKTFITKFGNNHIHHFSFHQGNKKLAAASHLGLIFIFDYNPDDTTTKVFPNFILSHDTISYPAINSAYFNSNGNWLITSGSDSRILRWNPFTGELIDSIAIGEHSNSVTSASFSFDDAMLLTSSWDSTAKIFNRTKLGLQIDTTDCLFSIVKPKVLSYDINFGKVFLGKAKDTLVNPIIINNSKIPLVIEEILQKGANEKEFSILTPYPKTILNPNDTLSLVLKFSPFDVGTRISKLVFKFKGGMLDVNLFGEGVIPPITIEPNLVEIGEVVVGEFKDTLLRYIIRNPSTKEIRLLSVRNIGPDSVFFSIIDGGETTVIKPKDYHPLTIRFTPNTLGPKNTIIEFQTDSEIPKSFLNIVGEGVIPIYDSITISIGNYFAKPGEIVNIPIKLKNQKFINKNSFYSGLGFDLSFNKTILEPIDNKFQSIISNDIRTLKILVEKENLDDSVLTFLRFKVGLGNDSVTSLVISNSFPLGKGKIVIKEESGKLFLKDLCKEGGIRLFEPDGKIGIGPISPNPTEGITYINFETVEEGKTKLELFNNSGNLVDVLLDEILKPGRYEIIFDANSLESGIYLLILRTPNNVLTKILQVVK
ncbi:MAG: T9SS type A sorting domain-containing protein [Ignavibacteria bacterium]|nr:T9SS type A sorting domain-containing protein [Ignavibacteria bacterium]